MGNVHMVVGLWACAISLFHLVEWTQGQNFSESQYYRLSDSEIYGMQQLYANWNKSTPELWKNLAGWRRIPNPQEGRFLSSPCFSESWRGVLCFRILQPTYPDYFYQLYNVSIIGLTLMDASLRGSLPRAIGNLTSLVSLIITGNRDLTGPLPLELQHLSYNLNILNLRGNGFNGSIPATLSSLYLLQQLDLSANGFNGPLEVDFRNWPVLSTLNLSQNMLTGNLKREYLQGLKELITLDLSSNNFTGPLVNLTEHPILNTFDLSANGFNGPLEVDFRNWTQLSTLNLSQNMLTGNLKREYLQGLKELITLDLSSNNFTGPLVDLTGSPRLNTLNLSFNGFNGDVRLSTILNNSISSSVNLKVVDISNNALTGLMPDFSNWTNLSVLDMSYNKFQATTFPVLIKNLPSSLQDLRLKGSNLVGQIPNQILQDFRHLKTLAIDDNFLSGTFDIGEFIMPPMLELLNITNNNITKVLYNGLSFKAIERCGINLFGNPYCNYQTSNQHLQQCVCLQKCIDPVIVPDSRKNSAAIIASSATASVLAIVIFFMGLVFWKIRREKQKLQLQVEQHFAENDIKPTIFTFNQLRSATEEFSERMKIGEGGFGAVYKGYLHENADHPVAVKRLFMKNQQSITEFLNEVVVVTAIKHRNLVNLKGCCVPEDQRLLVYEYMDNNDLAHHLFDHGVNQHLTWSARFNICLGVARGLHYLHASAQPRIIHRDIKASNILMDRELQPKIADFGLALFFPDEQTHIITCHVVGTRGYWAPEYATMGQLSEKVDVYSFGVLLLELVSGRRNLDHNLPEHKVYLCQWGRDLFNNSNVMELVDPKLFLTRDEESEVRRIINIAMLCLQAEPERRPTMSAIVATLEGSLNLEAEGMKSCLQVEPPLTWENIEKYPLQNDVESRLFSSETMGSSSMISLAMMGDPDSFGSFSTQ